MEIEQLPADDNDIVDENELIDTTMAKQDYSMIPREVISAKAELLPIMQEMLMLEKDAAFVHYEELQKLKVGKALY